MDPHRLAEERSVAYHALIAQRMLSDLSILTRARTRVEAWGSRSDRTPFYVDKWREILTMGEDAVAAFIVERSEIADELRQSSPFAGELVPAERWRIWRAVKARCGDPE